MIRILITPNVANPYDQRMAKALAQAFITLGHEAYALDRPVDSLTLRTLCQDFSITVVLQVNRTRDPAEPLPKGVRHIAWYQDVFPETQKNFAENFTPGDILYTLGSTEMLGLLVQPPCLTSVLFTGVTDDMLKFPSKYIVQDLDMSLCGGLPAPVTIVKSFNSDLVWCINSYLARFSVLARSRVFWLVRKALLGRYFPGDFMPYASLRAIEAVVKGFYRPLRGELDIQHLSVAMKNQIAPFGKCEAGPSRSKRKKEGRFTKLAKPYAAQTQGRGDWRARLIRYLAHESSFHSAAGISTEDRAISYFSQSYPRIMDRELLVDLARRVTTSLELWGPGLDGHDFALPFFKGVIDDQDALLRMYCRSKINLANNTHGLGLHSRTLECMAVRGFIFMHTSPHDAEVGGMHTEFEPDVHYGVYTPETFHDAALRWLRDDKGRRLAGVKAKKVIELRHRWIHRAEQILGDLNR